MSNVIDRIEQEFTVMGDSETTSLATSAIAELLKGAGGIAASSQKSKEDAAKAKEQEAKATKARGARLEATIALNKAQREPSNAALQEAALRADAIASAFEIAAGGPSGSYGSLAMQQPASGNFFTKMAGPMPVYGWMLTAVGVIGVGAVVVHYARKR